MLAPTVLARLRKLHVALLVAGLGALLVPFVSARADASERVTRHTPAREPGLTPQQLHAAYQLPATTASSSSQTLALIEVGGDPTVEADLAVYDKRYGLPACSASNGCLRVINQSGAPAPLPTNSFRSGESSIDVQLTHAVCQNCHILVVEADPDATSWIEAVGIAVNTAVRDGATEVTICIELYAGSTEAEEADYLTEANQKYFDHRGTVIAVASGDCGYDETNDPEHWQFCETMDWRYPSFPAKSPTVITVGGTSLAEHGGEWTSTIWKQGGSGCSSIFPAPLWQRSVSELGRRRLRQRAPHRRRLRGRRPQHGGGDLRLHARRRLASSGLGTRRRHVGGGAGRSRRVRVGGRSQGGHLSGADAVFPRR